jgi:hypothetical protein
MSGLVNLDPKGIIDGALDVFNRFFPDTEKTKREQFEAELKASIASRAQQLAINQTEAASANWFVAGWRPYIGWICGTGLGYQFLLRPLVNGFAAVFHVTNAPFPSLDTATLLQLLIGMLGMGALRSYDKKQGTNGNHS